MGSVSPDPQCVLCSVTPLCSGKRFTHGTPRRPSFQHVALTQGPAGSLRPRLSVTLTPYKRAQTHEPFRTVPCSFGTFFTGFGGFRFAEI